MGVAAWFLVPAAWAAGDVYEDDDTVAKAKGLANGRSQTRTIHRAGDVDWVRFTVPAVGARNVVLETAGESGDTQLWLYRANGTLAGYDNNSGGGNFSRIRTACLAPGVYAVKVREYGNDGTIPAYRLKVSWTPGDAWECDDSAAAARPIANGAVQKHSLHSAADADWAKFQVGPGGARHVRVETSGARGDTILWLYGPSDCTRPAAYNDDSAAGTFAQVKVASLRTGTYWIKVTSFQSCDDPGVIPAYALRVNWETP